ncbi:alpha/beta fold hydrolase [Actinocrispum wychmicini]|uniref:Lipase n=1 Tax=Actinocrispum wychmicini TaxID=1213861 RepID=A0A4R2JBP6_9PSEU|nr:alpha/beta hydrolase [Actinocrispum wychmicini]TCO53499.1 lipase [Actinocrispum wychmicini]
MTTALFTYEFGPAGGRPLLALHGLSGHGARWRRFAETQLAGFRVTAPDLRGHGRSTWNPPWRLEQFAEDVLALMDDRGLDRVPVMGHSYGGAIALYLANMVPDRVSRLVLVDPALGLDPETSGQDAEDSRTEELFATFEQARASQAERWSFASDDQVDDELAVGFFQDDEGVWHRRYSPAMGVVAWSEMARAHVVPPAGIPTLLAPALDADYLQPAFVADCRAVLGDDLTVREMDCGHMIYLERPAEFGKLVTEFLG